MIKHNYPDDGFAAIVIGDKANFVGKVRKGQIAYVHETISVVTALTLEELKTILTERGLKFSEPKTPTA
jgi:hypothetical protein